MGTICWKSQDVNPTIAGLSAEIHAGLDGNPFFTVQELLQHGFALYCSQHG